MTDCEQSVDVKVVHSTVEVEGRREVSMACYLFVMKK